MKTVNVRWSFVVSLGADKPVASATVVPEVEGWPGTSDEVQLQPGQWLEIVENGGPEAWTRAVVRG